MKNIKHNLLAIFTAVFLLGNSTIAKSALNIIHVNAGDSKISLGSDGLLHGIFYKDEETNYLKRGNRHKSALCAISLSPSTDKRPAYSLPVSAEWDFIQAGETRYTLLYPNDKYVTFLMRDYNSHVSFEVVDLSSEITELRWGPLYTNFLAECGQGIGALRSEKIVFMVQPASINVTDMSSNVINNTGTISAKSIDYSKARTVKKHIGWDSDKKQVFRVKNLKPVAEGSLIGAKIGMYAASRNLIMRYAEDFVKINDLPRHALSSHEGEMATWGKVTKLGSTSRIGAGYNMHNLDTWIKTANDMGFSALYDGGWLFETQGTFKLRSSAFPGGRKQLKEASIQAKKRGISLGLHTLTNFISSNDALVTPIPHQSLEQFGHTTLQKALGKNATTIYLADDTEIIYYTFEQPKGNKYVIKIGDELIQFDRKNVSETKPYSITNVERGWNGTSRFKHQAGATTSRLVSHPYGVFFPNYELQKQVAKNLATFFNETGITRTSLDGLEACRICGYGEFGVNLFIKTLYDALKNKNLVTNGSRMSGYSWFYNSLIVWGEPYHNTFRKSQLAYRLWRADMHRTNLMAYHLGGYVLSEKESLSDVQWVAGYSVGNNAGLTFELKYDKDTPEVKAAKDLILKQWLELRQSDKIKKSAKAWLANPCYEHAISRNKDGELEVNFVKQWIDLDDHEVFAPNQYYTETRIVWKDPVTLNKTTGKESAAAYTFEAINPKSKPRSNYITMELEFTAEESNKNCIENLSINVNDLAYVYKNKLSPGDYLYIKGDQLIVYDRKHNILDRETVPYFMVNTKIKNKIRFDYNFDQSSSDNNFKVTLNHMTPGMQKLNSMN